MTNDKLVTIVHTADLHYGYRQYGFIERERDMYAAGDYIVDQAINMKADAVLLSGDIFDMQKPPADAVKALCNQVRRLKDAGIPTLGIDGNHDACNGAWLEVCGVVNVDGSVLDIEGVRIGGLSYRRPSVAVAMLPECAPADGKGIDIFMIHQAVSEFADFSEGDVSAADMTPFLRDQGITYVAMGDIHAYKETVIGGIRWVYPGSPEMTASDETTDKTFSVIRFDPEVGELRTMLYPMDIRPVVEIQMTLDTELDTALNMLPAKVEGVRAPIIQLWYEKEAASAARQLEDAMRKRGDLFRSHPIVRSESGELLRQMSKESFDRSGAVGQLQAAVVAYFDAGTEQNELVFQFLDNPTNAREIVGNYLTSKGVEVDGITTV